MRQHNVLPHYHIAGAPFAVTLKGMFRSVMPFKPVAALRHAIQTSRRIASCHSNQSPHCVI
jgi:hypothetical protein